MAAKPSPSPPVTLPLGSSPEAVLAREEALAEELKGQVRKCRVIFADPAFDLPTLPASAMRILNLVQDPDVSPRAIAQALQTDPVLTAKFLRMANSPLYAAARKVESVQPAIDRLGIMTVREVVLAIAVNSTIKQERRLGPNAEALWNHAVNAAIIVQNLAGLLHLPKSNTLLLGLMHDIGKLPAWVMLNELKSRYPGVRPASLQAMVEAVHEEVGTVLLEVWGMTREIALVAGGHHQVTSLEHANQYLITKLSDDAISDCELNATFLACVLAADQALAAAKLSDEPVREEINLPALMGELGLSETQAADYLASLPKMLKDNSLGDL